MRMPLFVSRPVAVLTTLSMLLQSTLAVAQIRVDPAQPSGRVPTVDQAANGVPQVNIAAPSSAGVSHNKFLDYNVGTQGLILNNATAAANTQLGGVIYGNSNLNGTAARLILNEVTGTSASQLNGYTEIGGQKAELVVANPNGIACAGCGFINTSRVTLSTGTPVMVNGDLQSLSVVNGTVSFSGVGGDFTQVPVLDVISRRVTIDGPINANTLRMVAGRNVWTYQTQAVTPLGSDGTPPGIAIDSSALGGMYAGRISLIANEQGAGVRAAGQMAANAGDLTISADGQLTLANQIAATGNVALAGGGVANGGAIGIRSTADIANGGTVQAENGLSLAAGGDVTNSGQMLAQSGDATIAANGTIDNQHSIVASAGSVALSAGSLTNEGSITAQNGVTLATGGLAVNTGSVTAQTGTLAVTAGSVQNGGSLMTGDTLAIATTGNLVNSGTLYGQTGVTLGVDGTLDNTGGQVVAATGGLVVGGATQAFAATLTNGPAAGAGGVMAASGGALSLSAASLDNAGALSASGDVTVAAGQLWNSGTVAANGNLSARISGDLTNGGILFGKAGLSAGVGGTFDNSGGRALAQSGVLTASVSGDLTNGGALFGQSGVMVNVGGTLDNSGGQIVAATGDLTIGGIGAAVPAVVNNKVAGTGGVIGAAGGAVSIDAAGYSGDGQVSAVGALDLSVGAGGLDNRGTLSATGAATIASAGTLSNTGAISTAGDLRLSSTGDLVNGGGVAGKTVSPIDVDGSLTNTGTIVAETGALSLSVGGSLSNVGVFYALAGDLAVTAASLTNSGAMTGNGQVTIGVGNTLINSGPGARISALSGPLRMIAGALGNSAALYAASDLTVTTSGGLSNAGTMNAQGNLVLSVGGILDNRGGQIVAATGNLTIFRTGGGALANLLNQGGLIEANAGSLSLVSSAWDGGGTLSAGLDLSLGVGGDLQWNGQTVAAGRDLALTVGGSLDVPANQALQAARNLTVGANSLSVEGGLTAGGVLAANVAGDITLSSGLINGGSGVALNLGGTLTSNQGAIVANGGTLSIGGLGGGYAGAVINTGGLIEADGGDVTIAAGSIANQAVGTLTLNDGYYVYAGVHHVPTYGGLQLGILEYDSGEMVTGPSLISANGNITLTTTGDVSNQNSNITATGNIAISGANLYNQGTGGTVTFRQSCAHGDPNAGNCGVASHYFTEDEIANFANLTALVAVSGGTYGQSYAFTPQKTRVYVGSSLTDLAIYFGMTGDPSTLNLWGSVLDQGYYQYALFTRTVGGANIAAGGSVNIAASGQVSNGTIAAAVASPLASYSGSVGSFSGPGAVVAAAAGNGAGALTLPGGLFNTSTGLPARSGGQAVTFPSVDLSQLIRALPGGSALFIANPSPGARYLIETRPQYTQLSSLYGSQYLLDRLKVDPNKEPPFLGDAYFDTRYVAQEVLDATGKRYLDPAYVSDAQQMKTLLDNAAGEAGTLGLQVGVDLTGAQVAALTSDIVWYVPRTVNGETVLVPQVYLAKTDSANAQGNATAITAGGDLTVTAAGNIVNSAGTMASGQDLALTSAGGSIVNAGGRLSAGEAATLTAAGSVVNQSATVDWGNTANHGTSIASGAAISAGTALSVTAGQDIQALAASFSAGTDLSLTAGGSLTLGTLSTSLHGSESKAGYSFTLDATSNAGSQATAGGAVSLTAGSDLTVLGSGVSAGKDLSLAVGGNVTLASATDSVSTEANAKSGGGFMGGSKLHAVTQDVTNQVSTLAAAGGVTISAGNDLTSQAAQVSAGKDLTLSAGGVVSLLAVTDSSFASLTQSNASGVWQSSVDKGHNDTTVKMTGLAAGGTLSVSAAKGIVADYKASGDLESSIAALAKDPKTAWVATLATSSSVTWNAVKEAHSQWDHESQGLGPLASMIIAIAVAAATGGAGIGTMLAEAAGMAGSATAGVAMAAGFSTLVSQASISLIDNQGDLGKTLSELGSVDTVKTLAIAMAEAGTTQGILSSDTFQDIVPQGTDTVSRLEQASLQQGVRAGVGTVTAVAQGQGVGSSLEKQLLSAAGSAVGEVGAKAIGAAYADATLDPLSHEVAHALLGCAVGAANGSCTAGAVSGALSEAVAGVMGNALSANGRLDATTQTEILAAGQIAGILGAAAFGGNAQAASAAAYNAVLNNYLTTTQIANFKNEMAGCGGQGSAQCQAVLDKYNDLFIDQARTLYVAGGTDNRAFQTILASNDLSSTIDYLKQTNPGQTDDWYRQEAQSDLAAFQESVNVGQAGVPKDALQDLKALGYGILTAVKGYSTVDSILTSVREGATTTVENAAANTTPKAQAIDLPMNESQLSHIFRDDGGHLTDTPANRRALIDLVNNPQNLLGLDSYGNQWYAETLPNGTQLWGSVRNGVVQNGGLNTTPKTYNPATGLSRLK